MNNDLLDDAITLFSDSRFIGCLEASLYEKTGRVFNTVMEACGIIESLDVNGRAGVLTDAMRRYQH